MSVVEDEEDLAPATARTAALVERCFFLNARSEPDVHAAGPELRVAIGSATATAVPVDVPGSCVTVLPRPWLTENFGALPAVLGRNRIDLVFPDVRAVVIGADVFVTAQGFPVLGHDVVHQLSREGLVLFRDDGTLALRPAAGAVYCARRYGMITAAVALENWNRALTTVLVDGQPRRLRIISRLPVGVDALLGGVGEADTTATVVWVDDNSGEGHRITFTRHRARAIVGRGKFEPAPDVRLGGTTRAPPRDADGWLSFAYLAGAGLAPSGALQPTGLLALPRRGPILEIGASVSRVAAVFSDLFHTRRRLQKRR